LGHPRDAFGVGASTDNDWGMERDGTTAHMTWGREGDRFDPLSQIDDVTVTLRWHGPEGDGELTEVAPEHRIVPNQLRALVTASGRFEIAAELGALNADLSVSNEKGSWRYVPVLRRLP
jgi:hypothetical protein